MSVPELAELMGHAPAMTIGTYTHVIRELKGEPNAARGARSSVHRHRAEPLADGGSERLPAVEDDEHALLDIQAAIDEV